MSSVLVFLLACASGPFSRYRTGIENGPLPNEIRVTLLLALTQRMIARFPALDAVCFGYDLGDGDKGYFEKSVLEAIQSKIALKVRPVKECWDALPNSADARGVLHLTRPDGSSLHAGLIESGSWKRSGEFSYSVSGSVTFPQDTNEAGWYELERKPNGAWEVTSGPSSTP